MFVNLGSGAQSESKTVAAKRWEACDADRPEVIRRPPQARARPLSGSSEQIRLPSALAPQYLADRFWRCPRHNSRHDDGRDAGASAAT